MAQSFWPCRVKEISPAAGTITVYLLKLDTLFFLNISTNTHCLAKVLGTGQTKRSTMWPAGCLAVLPAISLLQGCNHWAAHCLAIVNWYWLVMQPFARQAVHWGPFIVDQGNIFQCVMNGPKKKKVHLQNSVLTGHPKVCVYFDCLSRYKPGVMTRCELVWTCVNLVRNR